MRFRATCYRAHDPRWSFQPLSGAGAAMRGARFNPKGAPALYLALTIMTAVKEINQGFAHKIEPCVLCSYDVDCEDVLDLRSEEDRKAASASLEDMACAWFSDISQGREPPSWRIARQSMKAGAAGILVPSFAPGARADDQNLVLWKWGPALPHKVSVFDPSGRLPKDQLSWK
ncbi:RES family NAD+ phosphorylase [Methylocystis heyeri]|uniref:RES domain-containing protein n=1 Tax=Methylocystis heyeri TaxID=391905 RepID=A0A6B8KJU4_9HYPH|nr:RES family NAD+ phosphorylase [Methylocystis heyeri]QGM47205.1 RES domain-containing protein [Methylocystis heyeri]